MKRNKCLRRKAETTTELKAIDTKLQKLSNRLAAACKGDVDHQLTQDLLNARLNLRVGLGTAAEDGEAEIAFSGTPSVDRLGAFGMFVEAVRQVWRNNEFVADVLVLSPEEPSGRVLASLSYAGTPSAIGNSILRRAPRYTLRVSDRLLMRGTNSVRKVMIHEAVHVVYMNHGREFRDLVRKHGGTVSEEAIENPGVHVQLKRGSRFETIKTFDTEPEATRWAHEQKRENPGKYRLSLGEQ